MKHTIFSTFIVLTSFWSTANAGTTFGVGLGSLYNGIGLNFGRTADTSLVYGSLGCMSTSNSRSATTNGDVVTRDSSYDTNCGFGFGFISTSFMPGNNHGLGLSLGYTYNTNDFLGGSEYHVIPSYYYFFNGVDRQGVILGFGTRAMFTNEEIPETDLTFNLGYQF